MRPTGHSLRRGCLAVAAVLLAVLGALDASAQTPPQLPKQPDPVRGREVAEKLCVACHRISLEQAPTGQADIPSFPEIANRPGRTSDFIMGAIMMPHPPMPDIALTTPALKDLAAYILTYKKAR